MHKFNTDSGSISPFPQNPAGLVWPALVLLLLDEITNMTELRTSQREEQTNVVFAQPSHIFPLFNFNCGFT
jgi:hypothetical protein